MLGTQLPDTNVAVLLFGLAAIACLVAGERLFPGRPVALLVVIAAIVALSVTPLAQQGFKTVGVLPAGLPDFRLPSLRLRDVDGVIPLAFACFLLAYIEGVSAARSLAQKHGYEIDARQELLALGAANAAAAFGQGYPVAGGLSQSTVNDKAGARTPLALVFASCAIGLCLLFLTDLLRNLPDVVLAAIVLVAVKGLINIPELRRVHALSRIEFWIAMVAFAGVLLLGILKGVMLAAIVSMLLLDQQGRRSGGSAARPHSGHATLRRPHAQSRRGGSARRADRAGERRTPLFQRGPCAGGSATARRGRRRWFAARRVGLVDVALRRHRRGAHAGRDRARACRARRGAASCRGARLGARPRAQGIRPAGRAHRACALRSTK